MHVQIINKTHIPSIQNPISQGIKVAEVAFFCSSLYTVANIPGQPLNKKPNLPSFKPIKIILLIEYYEHH